MLHFLMPYTAAIATDDDEDGRHATEQRMYNRFYGCFPIYSSHPLLP